jgi:GAF domain-containing protein
MNDMEFYTGYRYPAESVSEDPAETILPPELSMQIIDAGDEDTILRRFVSGAMKLINAASGIIYTIGDDGRSVTKCYPHPIYFKPPAPRINNKEGITRQVIATGKTMVFPDITKDERVNPRLRNSSGSMITVPLKIEGKVTGVLFLRDNKPRVFSKAECFLLEILAGQAAVAIKNAQLLEHIQTQHDAQIEAVNQISKSIAEPLNIAEVLDGILKWVITLMGKVTFCALNLLHKEKNKLLVVSERGVQKIKEEYREIPVGYGIIGWVAQHKKSQMVPDVNKDSRYVDALEGTTSGSEIAVPMLKGDDLIGVLNIEHREKNAFKPKDLALAEGIAGLAAIAIENSGLYIEMEAKVNERTRELKVANDRTAAAERLVLMNKMASEFVHKMNNLAGTIPVRINRALKYLDKNNPDHLPVIKELETVKKDSRQLLKAAGNIRRSTGTGEPENIDINALLEEVLSHLIENVPTVACRIKVVRNFSPDLPPIRVERTGLFNTLENIVRNGIDAVIGKGTLRIDTNIITVNREQFLDVAVSDNGSGIPEEILPMIFDLFFTTKKKGLGFGLWRDSAFAKRLGGDIDVEKPGEKGTTFHLRIPLKRNA